MRPRQPIDVGAAWAAAEARASVASRGHLHELRELLAQSAAKAAKYLSIGGDRPPTRKKFDRLVDLIAYHSSTAKVRQERLEALARIGQEINTRAGKQLVVVPRHAVIPEPDTLIGRGYMQALAEERYWREVFLRCAGNSTEAWSNEVLAGQVLMSAMLFGGILNGDVLLAVLRQLGEPLDHSGPRPCLVLAVPRRGEEDAERRLWYPDPITAMLLMRHRARLHAFRADKTKRQLSMVLIRNTVRRFLRQMKEPRRNSLIPTGLMRATRAALIVQGEPHLVAYAACQLASHSLNDSARARLHGAPLRGADPTGGEEGGRIVSDPSDVLEEADVAESPWIAGLRSAMAEDTRRKIRESLRALRKALRSTPGSLEWDMVAYALHVVGAGSRFTRVLRPETLRTYVIRPAVLFDAMRLSKPLHEHSPEELIDCYRCAVEWTESRDGKRKLVRTLDEFHAHLARTYDLEPMHVGRALGFRSGAMTVDANLITEDEYQRLLAAIDTSVLALRQRDYVRIARLLLILGYRLGLRRMEALKLRVVDVYTHDELTVNVWPHRGRSLKTLSSRRRLPAEVLLSEDEQRVLRDWVARRASEERKAPFSEYLFAIPELGLAEVQQDQVFRALIPLMRQVTGDVTLKYHHLRHSFASWTYLRLFLGKDTKAAPVLFPGHPKMQGLLEESRAFRARLLGAAGMASSVDLHALANLLGHSGPDVSLYHYVHHLDLAFALRHGEDARRMPTATLVAVAGLPQSTGYIHAKAGPWALVRACAKRHAPDTLAPHRHVSAPKGAAVPETGYQHELESMGSSFGMLTRVWHYLWHVGAHEAAGEPTAERWGFTPAQGRAMLARAGQLADMQVRNGGYRHRMSVVRARLGERRIACPPRLVKTREKEIFDELEPRLIAKLMSGGGELRELLDYYCENSWHSKDVLIFRDLEEAHLAKRYVRLCRDLGAEEVRLVSYDQRQRSPVRAKWKQALGQRMIHRQRPTHSKSTATAQWIGITPCFAGPADNQEACYAWRYALVLSSILACALQPPAVGEVGVP